MVVFFDQAAPNKKAGLSVLRDMADFFKNILVLTLAGILALPAGWCCRSSTAQAAATEGRACCRHKRPTKSPVQLPCGQIPRQHCCCVRDLGPAKERVSFAPVELGISSPLFLADRFRPDSACAIVTAAEPVSGPPLNILHCVWRC